MKIFRFLRRKKTIKDILKPLVNWTPIKPTKIRMCKNCGKEPVPEYHHKYCDTCHAYLWTIKDQMKMRNKAIINRKRKNNEYMCDPRGY